MLPGAIMWHRLCSPPCPLLPTPPNRKHSYVPSTEGSEFLMLCTFGLPRCLVLPPHPSNCPRKEALLTLLGQVAQSSHIRANLLSRRPILSQKLLATHLFALGPDAQTR